MRLLFPAILVMLLTACGCATRPDIGYSFVERDWGTWAIDDRPVGPGDTIAVRVKPFTVVVMPLDELNEKWDEESPEVDFDVWGWCDWESRTIYTHWEKWRWDRDGFPLPGLETLGHEVWHLPELGGLWHE